MSDFSFFPLFSFWKCQNCKKWQLFQICKYAGWASVVWKDDLVTNEWHTFFFRMLLFLEYFVSMSCVLILFVFYMATSLQNVFSCMWVSLAIMHVNMFFQIQVTFLGVLPVFSCNLRPWIFPVDGSTRPLSLSTFDIVHVHMPQEMLFT